ncbi:MAG: hypothetical protein QF893_04390 [Alphaproteobacteria bacterium]|jgi:hypothetical protein|nr:hypothetical protein [Alphaproteobacteria bacterium]
MEDPLVRPRTLLWRLLRVLARLQLQTKPCMAWDLSTEQRAALEDEEPTETERT